MELPAIFGSSFTPSTVMEQISREADVPLFYISDDGTLIGKEGDPHYSYIYKMVHNVKIISEALGGDPILLDDVDTSNVPDAN